MPTDPSTPSAPDQTDVNRRSFVKTAAAVTVAAAAVTSEGPLVKKAKAAEEKVQYGFIGPGSRGYGLLRRHLQHVPTGECVAICDIYQPNLRPWTCSAASPTARRRSPTPTTTHCWPTPT